MAVVLFVGAMMGCGIDIVGSLGEGVGAPEDPPSSDGGGGSPDTWRGQDDGSIADGDAGDAIADSPVDAIVADVDAPDSSTCGVCGPQKACVSGVCVPARRVFVSSSSSTASLGGVSGAGATCLDLATAAGLGGAWDAWVSSSFTSPRVRFTKATVPYRLVDGTLVANDWTELTSGNIVHAIDRDESGALVNDAEVWTSTKADGAFTGTSCSGFTSESTLSPRAAQGASSKRNGDWTNKSEVDCDRPGGHLYCFEQ